MKDSTSRTGNMDRGGYHTPMEITIKESGRMDKWMVSGRSALHRSSERGSGIQERESNG
jgi:hypothetical protein